ncbi:MAG: hypothetical protein J1F43_06680 [Muribaculaceae bacterium]|nr:hypothetical protein [Muribaculaceae bacterium]
MKYKNHIFGWLSVPAFLLTVACTDNADLNNSGNSPEKGKNVVALTVSTEAATAFSRADNAFDFPHISDGTKADQLIYAVYREDVNGKLQLVTDYINESTGGVNVVNNATFPMTIELVMDPSDEFTVAFWAQSSECKAYDISDLTKVKVDYSKISNNYELGDAFCNIATVKGNDTGKKQVELRRPFAQINVGDAGWDYEAAAILNPNPRTYAKSSITLKGLAQYYNVLEGRTLTDSDLDAAKGEKAIYDGEVKFDMSYMPAFINLTSYDDSFDWDKLSYLPYSEEFGPKDDDDDPVFNSEIEEFLKLNLNGDSNDFASYIGYDTGMNLKENFDAHKLTDTEHFKYLSMCYVLVPVAKDEDNKVKGAVIDKLTFTVSDNSGKSLTLFTINQVPVQQNWRTNIISDKMFMAGEKFRLYIVPTYAGDFNNASGNNSGDSWNLWDNVEMNQKEDADGNLIWYVKDTDKPYGNPNDDFLGTDDNDGQYDDWDDIQDNPAQSQDPTQGNE